MNFKKACVDYKNTVLKSSAKWLKLYWKEYSIIVIAAGVISGSIYYILYKKEDDYENRIIKNEINERL